MPFLSQKTVINIDNVVTPGTRSRPSPKSSGQPTWPPLALLDVGGPVTSLGVVSGKQVPLEKGRASLNLLWRK